jgi:flagella basal body P-ring formation protein FlgA
MRHLVRCVLLIALAFAGAACAQGETSGLQQRLRDFALASAPSRPDGPRVEVIVGEPDARLRLAPCERIEPYLPGNVRLWGKARVGVRCVDGPVRWNIYLPVTVKVWGRGLVATRALPAGASLVAGDVAPGDVDLAEDPSTALGEAGIAVGRTLTRPLAVGQSVRMSHLKLREWFAAGETVQVIAQGPGFRVTSEAQALNPGVEGREVRVKTEGGRVLTGLPVGERRVEVSM